VCRGSAPTNSPTGVIPRSTRTGQLPDHGILNSQPTLCDVLIVAMLPT